jgi:hypothetical protein
LEIKAGEILDAHTPEATPVPEATGQPIQEAKPQGQEDNKLSGRLEILMRREQGILQKERQVKDLEAQIQEKLKLLDKFEEAKKGNSKTALELLGLDYNQLSESILKDGQIPPEVHVKKLEEQIEELKKGREQDLLSREEEKKKLQAEAEQKAITDFKGQIDTYLKDNKSRYELTHFWEMEDLVYEVIDEHYTRTLDPETGTGKVLSIKEAADKVEEHLEKKFTKAKEVEKVKALWGAIPKNAQDTLAKQLATKDKQPPKTLTNNMAPAPTTKPPRLNEEQRVRDIVAKFRAEKGL